MVTRVGIAADRGGFTVLALEVIAMFLDADFIGAPRHG